MKNKVQFFLKTKRILCYIGLGAIFVIFIYLITYNLPPVGNLSVDLANSIWNIILNISCSYLVSLIFYIILVLDSDYNTYQKKMNISHRISSYFWRMNTYINAMFEILIHCSNVNSIDEYITKGIDFDKIENRN
jgi:uncharacterized membrane protein YesL